MSDICKLIKDLIETSDCQVNIKITLTMSDGTKRTFKGDEVKKAIDILEARE